MNRIFTLLGTTLALSVAAHAQTVSSTYTTSNGWGTTVTTTIQGPTSAVGAIANQGFYSGSYAGFGVPSYGVPCVPNYGYSAPAYYPGQSYFVPGYTVPLGQSQFGWDQPASITALPQIITTPAVPAYPVYPTPTYGYGQGYGYGTSYGQGVPCQQPSYGYGYGYGGSRTTIAGGGISYGRGGLNVSIGGTVVRERSR